MATIFALDQPESGGYDTSLLVPVVVSVVPGRADGHVVRFRSFRNLLSPRAATAGSPPASSALAIVAGLVFAPGSRPAWSSPTATSSRPRSAVLTAPLRERWFGPDAVAPPPAAGCRRSSCPTTDDRTRARSDRRLPAG